MLVTLLLVAALLSCVNSVSFGVPTKTSPSEERQVLSPSSLQYVYVFFRHGIRSPLYKPYPTDPNRHIFYKYFKLPLGQLTKAGKEEMYEVGKRLLEIYGKFIGDFSVETVRASSTETSRTIMSALSAMAGLFPPKQPLFKGLEKWQPIPIWQDTRVFDKVYLYNDPDFPKLALKQCPRYGQMIQKGYDLVLGKDQNRSHSVIYQLLQRGTGEKDVDSIDSAYQIFDILEMEKLNGLNLPYWATKPQPAFCNKPLFPDLLRPLQVEWFYTTQWLGRNPEMLLFYSGPLFYNINDKFYKKIEKKEDSKERFRYHSTHDDTILTLRWALGFDDPNFEVMPGDGIAFELHKLKNKYYVQVVYYHSLRKPKDFREVLQLPNCPSPCSYDRFSKIYPSLSPQDWENKCKIPSKTTPNGNK